MRSIATALVTLALVLTPGSGAVAQEPSPAAEGRRVEFADVGIAITVPPDWEAYPMDVSFLEGPGRPGAVQRGTTFVSASEEEACFAGFSRTPIRGPAGTSRPALTLDEVESTLPASRYVPELANGYETMRVQTAAGEALKATWSQVVQGLERWVVMYVLISDDSQQVRQELVVCYGLVPGEDWLHIVDTLEFLEVTASPPPQ